MMRCRKKGFSLIEMVVVVAIMSLLTAVALPAYERHVRTSNRMLAVAALYATNARQQQFFAERKRYARSLLELGYTQAPYGLDRTGRVVAGAAENRIYIVELSTQVRPYTVSAIPQLAQSRDTACGTLSLTSSGMKDATGKAESGVCW